MKKKIKSLRSLSLVIIGIILVVSTVLIINSRTSTRNIALKAVSDGSGGVIAAWYQNQGIHVQRFDSSGNLLWPEEAVLENTNLKQPDYFTMIEDDQGGVIITWGDTSRVSDEFDPIPIYSQRLTANGEALWGEGVSTGAGELHGFVLSFPKIIPDGVGGVFILWNDFKPAFRALHDDFFRIQKLSPQGKPVWEEPGKLLFSSPPFHATTPEEKAQGEKGTVTRSWPIWTDINIISDGRGGAIVIWQEEIRHRYVNLKAQRFNADGKTKWEEGGVLVYSAWDASVRNIADCNNSTAIIIEASRQESVDSTIFGVQKITSDGKILWPGIGIALKNSFELIGNISVISQNTDVIVLWQELVSGPEIISGEWSKRIFVYAEKLSADGSITWQTTPLIRSETGENFSELVIRSNSDSILLAWRTGQQEQGDWEIFTQKIDSINGEVVWSPKQSGIFGVEFQYKGVPEIMSDGSGGAIIIAVVGKNLNNGDMIYAQRLDPAGNTLWGEGIRISR